MTKILALLALVCLAAAGQTNNFAAAGVSYNPGGSPSVAGTALYARLITGSGTWAFTVIDALPQSVKPFSVSTAISAGISQKLATISGIDVYVPTSAGVSYTGKNTGWQWSSGGMAAIKLHGAWRILPNVRFLKSSVSNGSDYQVIAGIMFGTGW